MTMSTYVENQRVAPKPQAAARRSAPVATEHRHERLQQLHSAAA
jgi:hypothetical protein